MSAVEPTLNVTVAQIEGALLKGQTVPDFAREWSEPASNVLAVYRRMQDEGRLPKNGPSQVATPPSRPLTSVPNPLPSGSAPTVDALVNAAARSTSKRTQALGVRLADLADVVRGRLADERKAAEKADRERVEHEAARAEIERLKAALVEARAKAAARPGYKPRSAAGRATAEKYAGKSPCGQCGKQISNHPLGRSAHKRHCTGAA